ncbi:hypothetical protein PCL_11598 [Purpureocillium lilacinum]|uniref:Uncharacterized protein n=1 Tax=Purpureocillium lilacinum TaxID=33203 RepID=A0A2U3EAH1_PURLI|nr:hypothetical protein PCL_11598 [Purpureocillium lilacinum]
MLIHITEALAHHGSGRRDDHDDRLAGGKDRIDPWPLSCTLPIQACRAIALIVVPGGAVSPSKHQRFQIGEHLPPPMAVGTTTSVAPQVHRQAFKADDMSTPGTA